MYKVLCVVVLSCGATSAFGQMAEISPQAGERISIIGGCHDCHTAGYSESGGTIDPATALKGNPVGYQGPWGTTYAVNLRLEAQEHSEDEWVEYLSTLEAMPPMPWFNVHAFTEEESRSLYQYIIALGAPGEPAPENVPPGGEVRTPFIVMAPPTMPAM